MQTRHSSHHGMGGLLSARVFLPAGAVLLAAAAALAGTFPQLTLKQMTHNAHYIVEGVITTKKAAQEPTTGHVWTTYTIAVTDTLKSPDKTAVRNLEIRQLGGQVGDLRTWAPNVPHFDSTTTQALLLFTQDYGAGWQSVANGPQGALRADHTGKHLHGIHFLYPDTPTSDLPALKQQIRTLVQEEQE